MPDKDVKDATLLKLFRREWDALRDLVPFVPFTKPPMGVLLSVKLVTLPHGCFSLFLNCTNATKSRKASYIDPLKKLDDYLLEFLKQNWNLQYFSFDNMKICTSNHMFKRDIWNKFTYFTFKI